MNRRLFRIFARIYIKNEARRPGDSLKQSIQKRLERYGLQIESLTSQELSRRLSREQWCPSEVMFHALHSARGMFRMAQELRNGSAQDLEPERIGKTKTVTREDLVALCTSVDEVVSFIVEHAPPDDQATTIDQRRAHQRGRR